MAKNDFTAQAGISLEQWKKDIANMDSSMAKIDARSASLEKSLNKVGGGLKIGAAVVAAASFAKNLALVGRAGGEASEALESINKDGLDGSLTKSQKLKGAFLDISGAISSIPIVGKVWDFLTAPITATARFKKGIIEVEKVLGQEAVSTDAIIGKTSMLNAERTKLLKTTTFLTSSTLSKNRTLAAIESELVTLTEKHAEASERQATAQSSTLSGSERDSKLAAIEQERQEAIAKATEAVKDAKFGGTTQQGQAMVDKATEDANALAEAKITDAEIAAQLSYAEASTQIAISKTRMDGLDGAVSAARELLSLAENEQNVVQEQSVEVRNAARVKTADAKASLALAERQRDLAMIEITLNKDLIAARKIGISEEAKSADAKIKAAQKTQEKYGAGSIAGQQAKQQEEAAIIEKRNAENKYRLEQGNLDITEQIAKIRDDGTAKQTAETDARIALLTKEKNNVNVVGDAKRKIIVELAQLEEQKWNNQLANINKAHAIAQANIKAGQGIGARAGREVNIKELMAESKKFEDMKKAGAPEAELAAQRAIVNQKARGVEQDRHGVNLALEAMDIQLRTSAIKMTASERVAKLAENEANYQQRITEALRNQDSAMANRLSKEKARNALQIEADELLKSPKQKADEAKEQRKKNKALDIATAQKKARDEAAAREKAKFMADNALRVAHGFAPLPMPDHFGPVRAGDALGAATRKKIDDAVNRDAIPIKPGEKKADVAEMKVVNLIVKALKSD
jgi:hypothetical protein